MGLLLSRTGTLKIEKPQIRCLYHILDINIFADSFNYIEEVKCYTYSKRGFAMMVDQNGYIYSNLCTKTPDPMRTYWRCHLHGTVNGSCKAKAVVYDNKITKKSGIHTHPPPIMPVEFTN